MTTVIMRRTDNLLEAAADGRITVDSSIISNDATKVVVLLKPKILVAQSGLWQDLPDYKKLEKKRKITDEDVIDYTLNFYDLRKTDSCLLFGFRDRLVEIIIDSTKEYTVTTFHQNAWAIGSGSSVALLALKIKPELSLEEAVDFAAQSDIYTGGKIKTYQLAL